jgi:hypothetical protein
MSTIRGGRYTILGAYELARNMIVLFSLVYHHLGCVSWVAHKSSLCGPSVID